ncbi:MAG: carbamoyl-phosphate synthase large subunit, partial [Chloroflexota bacterium]
MKSVGEVMAIGRTFPEALNKALRSLEIGVPGFSSVLIDHYPIIPDEVEEKLRQPTAERLFYVAGALSQGTSVETVSELTGYDPWFVSELVRVLEAEDSLREIPDESTETFQAAKRLGIADEVIARLNGIDKEVVRNQRIMSGVAPVYYRVDTCAAEFEAFTPYLYSTYESHSEVDPTDRQKVMIIGGGPNRIGQGIEFDYCCVQACWALRDMDYETIMVNCNPETVSTDYDTADRLYFEPLVLEDILNVIDVEKPDGVIVQFGGQTPINLTEGLAGAGVPVWGTPPDSIALAEDRGRFGALLREMDMDHPDWGMARSLDEARAIVDRIGYPVLVRPSFVLGGRAMAIAYDDESLEHFLQEATSVSEGNPVLIDQFIEDAFEVDVDAIGDGEQVIIAGILQHIEEAGVHSGDSACVMPPYKVSLYHLNII